MYLSLCTDYKPRSAPTSSSVLGLCFDCNWKNYCRILFAARFLANRAANCMIFNEYRTTDHILGVSWKYRKTCAVFVSSNCRKSIFLLIQYGLVVFCIEHRSLEHLLTIGKNNCELFLFCFVRKTFFTLHLKTSIVATAMFSRFPANIFIASHNL